MYHGVEFMTKRVNLKHYADLGIGLFLLFAFGWFCPTWATVTRQGVQGICILAGAIWLVAHGYGMITPSLFIMLAMVLTGYIDCGTIISTTLGSSAVWQLIMMFMLLYALNASGADAVLARWMISRKIFSGKPMLFSGIFVGATTVLAALAGSLGAYLFGVSLVDSIAVSAGYDNRSPWKKAMTAGVLIVSSVGGGILPFKGLGLLVYNLMEIGLGEVGIVINQGAYIVSATLSGILICLLFTISLKLMFHVDFSKLAAIDVVSICAAGNTRFNRRQTITMCIFCCCMLYTVFPYLPQRLPFYELLNEIGQNGWFLLMVLVLTIIRVDGESLLNISKSMSQAINWDIIWGVCGFTAVGSMISNEELGVRTWLTWLMESAFGNVSFPVFVLVLVLMTLLLTNFITNTAAAIIISTISGPLLIEYAFSLGVNVSCVLPGIVMSSLCAFLTMAAGGSAPLFLATDCMKENPKWIWTYGLWIIPIVSIALSAGCLICSYML